MVPKAPSTDRNHRLVASRLCFSEIRSGSTRLQHQPAFRFGTPSLHGASVERCRSESTSMLEILGSLTQNARIGRGPPRRNGPYMNPHYWTPLNIPARFRRRDVRSDDAARQPAALLTLAPTPATAPSGSPACPSAATDECACRDNTPRIISHADTMTPH